MLGADYIDLLREHIQRESEQWVAEYIAQRRATLLRQNARATQQLIDSMEAEVQEVTSGAITNTIELAFAEHGRYLDMKRLQPAAGGSGYLNELAQWIVDKSLYDKMVQRYVDSRGLQQPPKNVLQNIAWAIVKKRAARTPRRKRWYASSSAGAVTDLFNRVAAGMPDLIIQELKKGFQDGSTAR